MPNLISTPISGMDANSTQDSNQNLLDVTLTNNEYIYSYLRNYVSYSTIRNMAMGDLVVHNTISDAAAQEIRAQEDRRIFNELDRIISSEEKIELDKIEESCKPIFNLPHCYSCLYLTSIKMHNYWHDAYFCQLDRRNPCIVDRSGPEPWDTFNFRLASLYDLDKSKKKDNVLDVFSFAVEAAIAQGIIG